MKENKITAGFTYKKSVLVTEKMVQDFALCTGDNNPVHLNDNYAKASKFKSKIAHGLLVGSPQSQLHVCQDGRGEMCHTGRTGKNNLP